MLTQFPGILAEIWLRYVGVMLWQSSLVMLVVWGLYLAFRKQPAALRYSLLCLVLVKLVLPTGLHSVTGIAYWGGMLAHRFAPAAPAVVQPAATEIADFPNQPERAPALQEMAALYGTPAAPLSPAPSPHPSIRWPVVLFAGWLVTVLMLGGALILYAVRIRRPFAGATEVTDPRITELLAACANALGIRRRVRLFALPGNETSPLLCGLLRPRILLSTANLKDLTIAQLRPVFLHELAHLKRRDLWVNAVQVVLQVLWFFHPGLWLTNWLLRREREHACDDIVLANLGSERRTYADSMLAVLKTASSSSFSAVGLLGIAERTSALKDRLRRILDKDRRIVTRLGVTGALALLAVGCVLLPMAGKPHTPAKEAATAAIAQESDAPAASLSNIRIQLERARYDQMRRIKVQIIPLQTNPDADEVLQNALVQGKGSILIMSGTSVVQRTAMSKIIVPDQGPGGLSFYHFVGLPGRNPGLDLPPGKYKLVVVLPSSRSNEVEFEIARSTVNVPAVMARLLTADRQAACDEILSWQNYTSTNAYLITKWAVDHVVECRQADGKRVFALFSGVPNRPRGKLLLVREDGFQIPIYKRENYLQENDRFVDVNADGVMEIVKSAAWSGYGSGSGFQMLLVLPVSEHQTPLLSVAFDRGGVCDPKWRWSLQPAARGSYQDVVLDRKVGGEWKEASRYEWSPAARTFTGPAGRKEDDFLAFFSAPVFTKLKDFSGTDSRAGEDKEPTPGQVILPAKQARLTGHVTYTGNDALEYWQPMDGEAAWQVPDIAPGLYDIAIRCSAAYGYGGEYVLEVNKEKLAGNIAHTGGWSRNYRKWVSAGRVEVKESPATVRLYSTAGGEAFINLESITLTPVAEL